MKRFRIRNTTRRAKHVSVVEIETELPTSDFDAQISQELTDYCLAALNRFLDVYQVLTEQWNVHHLNPDNVGPALVIELRVISDQPTGHLAMPNHQALLPHERPPFQTHLLPTLPAALRMEPHNHPLDQVRRLYARASRYAETGEYEAAIETLQVSAERLVYGLHRLLLVEAGHLSADIDARLPTTFKRALLSLAHQLGGDWHLQGPGAVAIYWRQLYELRNRLVHGGIAVERDMVPDAFEAYNALWNHVLGRCVRIRRQHPRLALAVHGGVGLRKAGALDGQMRAFIDGLTEQGEQYSFWQPADLR